MILESLSKKRKRNRLTRQAYKESIVSPYAPNLYAHLHRKKPYSLKKAWVYCFRISNSRATTPVKLGTKVLRHWLISVNLRVMMPLVCVYAWILICIFFVWQWHKLIVFRQKTGKISCMCEESFLDWSNIFTCQKFYWYTSEAWIFTLQSHNIRWNLQVSV